MKSQSSRTYILPTLYGLCFAFVCILLLGVAFASSNNAVYFLCFVLAALGVQSLVITNKNIEQLQISHVHIPDFFADETGLAVVGVYNSLEAPLENIRCEFGKGQSVEVPTLKRGERREVSVPLAKKSAGKHTTPNLKVSSDFPFYFSRSWKTFNSQAHYWVYPPRIGRTAFSKKAFYSGDLDASSEDEFKGHRDYRDNDSPRSIDWKVTSRLQKLTVKEHEQLGVKKIWLRWQDIEEGDSTSRQAQLSLWIDLAEKNDFEYGLELPSVVFPLGRGPQHKTKCLKALL